MTNWNQISAYVLAPKFKEVCYNITRKGYRSELSDDLYQEVILSMLEKVHNQSAPILRAWENNYIDWYIVSAAHNIFISNNGSNFAKLKYVSSSTGDTNVQYVATDTEGEVEYDEMIKLCESELGKQYWYNSRLFLQYALEDNSVRKIEAKTGIPRNSIHRTIRETKRIIVKKAFKLNMNLLIAYKKTMSWRKISKKTGIPTMTLHCMLAKHRECTKNSFAENQIVTRHKAI